jgi:hypothetical protein
LDGTRSGLELLVDPEIVAVDQLSPLLKECHQLSAVMTAITKKVKSSPR